MTYGIKTNSGYSDIDLIDIDTGEVIKKVNGIDEANKLCWSNRNPDVRFQILANSWSSRQELTWWDEEDGLIIPNGYPTIEEARLAIVEDLQECCVNNDYKEHPNPHGDYSIIDTFTEEEIDYSISYEEYSHPDPDFEEIEEN